MGPKEEIGQAQQTHAILRRGKQKWRALASIKSKTK